MITTVEHPRLGEVVLSQSRRARRISISVRGTGCVRLSFPCGVSARRAMEFLEHATLKMLPGMGLFTEVSPAATAAAGAAAGAGAAGAAGAATGAAARRQSRPARPYRSALPHHGAEVQQADDPCLAYEVGELYRDEQHFAEPFPDDASGAFARFRHCPRVVPYRSPRPFPEVPCVGRPAGRGQ